MIMAKKCLKHMRRIGDFFYTIAGRNIGAAVSAFARLGAGDQIGHPYWSQWSSNRRCKYCNGYSRIGFSYAGKAKIERGGQVSNRKSTNGA
jgi:hypothetical protein